MEQGHADARTGGPDGVSQGDRAAVDVQLVVHERELAAAGEDLGGEGLVQLDQVVVLDRRAVLLLQRLGRGHGTEPHDRRIEADLGVAVDARERREAERPGLRLAHEHQCGGAVGDAARVARVHGAVLAVEYGGELGQALQGGPGTRVLVLLDDGLALARLHGHRRDLGVEASPVLSRPGLLLAREGEAVLLVAGDVQLARELLRRLAHEHVGERTLEAVLVHRVDDRGVSEAISAAHAREQVGQSAHALGTPGYGDVGAAELDRLDSQGDRLQPRAAGHVHGVGGRARGHPRAHAHLARDVGTAAGLAAVPEDELPDLARLHARAPDEVTDHRRPQIRRREVGERTEIAADRCP